MKSLVTYGFGLLVVWAAWCGPAAMKVWSDEPFAHLQPFLETHCHDCHQGDDPQGQLSLTDVPNDLSQPSVFQFWQDLFDRVSKREMPPIDASQPADEQRDLFLSQLGAALRSAHEEQKGTVFRRLNRIEYQNTLNDLFGTHLDLVSELPEDGRSGEFDNIGESLSVSLVQLKLYLDAAERVLTTAIESGDSTRQSSLLRANYADTRDASKFVGKQWLQLDDDTMVFFRRLSYPTGMLREAVVRESGFYRVRVTGYAYQSATPITFSVGATTYKRGAAHPTFGYFAFPPLDPDTSDPDTSDPTTSDPTTSEPTTIEPTTIELTTWIDDRYMIQIEPYGIYDSAEIKKVGIENFRGPGLAIQQIEIQGPLLEAPARRGYRLIFEGLDRREILPNNPRQRSKPWYQPQFEIVSDHLDADIEKVLSRVATAAFRRPTESDDVNDFMQLFRDEQGRGASIEDALRAAIAAILCSTDFLYLHESPGRLDDHALASRLSYFLSRTTPDATLLQLAKDGELTADAGVRRRQVDRLINSPKFDRFVNDFTNSWLDLRSLDFTTPDQRLFPEYDSYLRFSIELETNAFFKKLVRENLPVVNIVKSDFAMLNQRLAEHYGIAGVTHPDVRAVALDPESPRGGFLSQASVLKVSANGTNTSPVLRGTWVRERIFGETVPPPPAGVSGIEPDTRGAVTLRELLEKHRDNDSCRRCHQLIDPPGFALESFDPVGRWRERFRSSGSGDYVDRIFHGRKVRYRLGPPVDASCELPNGETFAGYLEFRDHLASQPDALSKTLVTKLLTFATGREMGFSDRMEIDRIAAESREAGYGVRDLIRFVVESEIFRCK